MSETGTSMDNFKTLYNCVEFSNNNWKSCLSDIEYFDFPLQVRYIIFIGNKFIEDSSDNSKVKASKIK